MEKLYKVELPYEELLMLDGKVLGKAQAVIDTAKRENSIGFDLPIMNEIILKSLKLGTFSWRSKSITSCPYCDKKHTYHKYPRDSRNHRKGDFIYDKPMYYSGIVFNVGCVTIKGLGDMCADCNAKFQVRERITSYILEHDLPIQITNDERNKYIKDPIRICWDCGREMQESQMRKLPAVFGGYYPSECPHCKAQSNPFGKSHKHTDKFVMLPTAPIA